MRFLTKKQDIVTVGDAIEVIKKCKANKGKKKKISAATLKSKQTVVPHPDSPFMSKPAGSTISKDFSSKETQEAMKDYMMTSENLKIIPNHLKYYTFTEPRDTIVDKNFGGIFHNLMENQNNIVIYCITIMSFLKM